MKTFDRDNFLAFMASESDDDEDSTMISSQGMASTVLERFDAWLEKPDTVDSLIKLPVTVNRTEILDADGEVVLECYVPAVAKALAEKLNADYVDPDSFRYEDN